MYVMLISVSWLLMNVCLLINVIFLSIYRKIKDEPDDSDYYKSSSSSKHKKSKRSKRDKDDEPDKQTDDAS